MTGGSVFVRPFEIEKYGHIGSLWSDESRHTRAECSCSAWSHIGADAKAALAAWRDHVEAAT